MTSTPLQMTVSRLRVPVTDEDHIRGATYAPVTIVQYADFQCPHSAAAHGHLLAVLREQPENVRLVFRYFPLTTVHPYAQVAAETAQAAGERGRFWQLHDWLFAHSDVLDPDELTRGVRQVGLPAEAIAQEVDAHLHRDRVQRDFVSGIHSGVQGTPAFFVNGVRHDGGYRVPDLLAAVDRAMR